MTREEAYELATQRAAETGQTQFVLVHTFFGNNEYEVGTVDNLGLHIKVVDYVKPNVTEVVLPKL